MMVQRMDTHRKNRPVALLLGALALAVMAGGEAPAAGDFSPKNKQGSSEPFSEPSQGGPNTSLLQFKSQTRRVACETGYRLYRPHENGKFFICAKHIAKTFRSDCSGDWKQVATEGKDFCLHEEARRHAPQCPGRTAFQPGKRIIQAGPDRCDPKYSTEQYPRCRLPGTSKKADYQGTEDVCLPVKRNLECERYRDDARVDQQTGVGLSIDHSGKKDRCVRKGYVFRPPKLEK